MDNIELIFILYIPVFIAVLIVVILIILEKRANYRNKKIYEHNKKLYEETSYYSITNIPYSQLNYDSGCNGEYLIYKALRGFEQEGAKFLFNLYIPTNNNKTTEIDVVMISSYGIFVFESKNYSGWIFGTESQKRWTQSLHVGYGGTKKEHFYNPIMQNEYHITCLSKLLENPFKYHSIIVFSDDCEFKKIVRNQNSGSYLVHRYRLYYTIHNIMLSQSVVLSSEDILNVYNKLYPYSQVDENTKYNHIKNLKFKS